MATRLLMRVLFFSALLGLVYFFYASGFNDYFTLEYIKAQQIQWNLYNRDYYWTSLVVFICVYVLLTAASIPGGGLLSLVGGAIFGLGVGTLVVALASTTGAAFAFLSSRWLFGKYLSRYFHELQSQLNKGLEDDGIWFFVTIRLIPAFPFFLVNLLMGLTPMKTVTFFWTTLFATLPATFIYVNAGTQLAGIMSVQDIFSPDVLLSFALLAVFPLLAKLILEVLKIKK